GIHRSGRARAGGCTARAGTRRPGRASAGAGNRPEAGERRPAANRTADPTRAACRAFSRADSASRSPSNGPLPPKSRAPGRKVNDGEQIRHLASVREIEQLTDRLLVCCRKLVLIHLLRRDPAVIVHLLVVVLAAHALA